MYESLESMIQQHSLQPNGMVTLLTEGCPVRYYIVQDSLFPAHQASSLITCCRVSCLQSGDVIFYFDFVHDFDVPS